MTPPPHWMFFMLNENESFLAVDHNLSCSSDPSVLFSIAFHKAEIVLITEENGTSGQIS